MYLIFLFNLLCGLSSDQKFFYIFNKSNYVPASSLPIMTLFHYLFEMFKEKLCRQRRTLLFLNFDYEEFNLFKITLLIKY